MKRRGAARAIRYSRLVRTLLVAAVSLLVAAAPNVAQAWCQSCTVVTAPTGCAQPCFCPVDTDEDAHLLFWDRACIEVAVEDDPTPRFTTAALDQVVDRSFARWTDVDCGGRDPGFTIRRSADPALCDFPEYVSDEGNANSIVVVQDGWEERELHDRAAFALTTTFFLTETGEIIDADMELNETNWDFDVCPEAGCTDDFVDLENTITHEAGHFFGLAHADADPDATMWACADVGETMKRTLESDDIEGMCTIYGPGALPESCEFTPRGGFDPFCAEDREDCGCRAPGAGRALPPQAFLFGLALLWLRRRRAARG